MKKFTTLLGLSFLALSLHSMPASASTSYYSEDCSIFLNDYHQFDISLKVLGADNYDNVMTITSSVGGDPIIVGAKLVKQTEQEIRFDFTENNSVNLISLTFNLEATPESYNATLALQPNALGSTMQGKCSFNRHD